MPQAKFFLGANSPEGFVSLFSDCYSAALGWHTYIIKGGPGTGKSTLMKRVAEHFLKRGEECVLCPCSSDPSSLDGVIFPKKRVALLDGTAPHIVEPKLPGAAEEIINLGDCWQTAKLIEARAEIIEKTNANRLYHKKASNYISAAGVIARDIKETALSAASKNKAKLFGKNLLKKYLPKKEGEPIIWRRFLSGITPRGLVFYRSTIENFYETRVLISDPFGAIAPIILREISEGISKSGYEAIICACPLDPSKTEHILVPELGLYFGTLNRYLDPTPTERVIHARRFMDMRAIHEERGRIKASRRLLSELIDLASDALSNAKFCHDELEAYYIAAMDREKLKQKTEDAIKAISNL